MIELVLALQLLGDPAGAPRSALDLGPGPSEVERSGAQRRPVRLGTVASAAAGIAVADVAAMIPIAIGLIQCMGDVMSYGSSGACRSGAALIVVGAAAFVLVPPAAGVLGARLAGERGDAAGSAYALALVVRLGALALATGLPGGAGIAAIIGTELVLAPYVIARVLAGSPPVEAARSPAAAAVPVRDPAGVRGS